jgi:mannose-6-phosphate isomerase-like protein (cupin superfamily)
MPISAPFLLFCASPSTLREKRLSTILVRTNCSSFWKESEETLRMRESDERPWGRYEVLEEQPGFKVKVLEVKPGARLSLQRHAQRQEHWVVVSGVADVVCGEQELRLQRGEHVHIPLETNHRLGNSGQAPLAIIEVQLGDYLGEDDIVRLADDYQRID